jgi:hypothetical protein
MQNYWAKSNFTRKILCFLLSLKWISELNRSKILYPYWTRNWLHVMSIVVTRNHILRLADYWIVWFMCWQLYSSAVVRQDKELRTTKNYADEPFAQGLVWCITMQKWMRKQWTVEFSVIMGRMSWKVEKFPSPFATALLILIAAARWLAVL